jgi:hypothetical protein
MDALLEEVSATPLERRFWEDVVAATPSEVTSLIIVEW